MKWRWKGTYIEAGEFGGGHEQIIIIKRAGGTYKSTKVTNRADWARFVCAVVWHRQWGGVGGGGSGSGVVVVVPQLWWWWLLLLPFPPLLLLPLPPLPQALALLLLLLLALPLLLLLPPLLL